MALNLDISKPLSTDDQVRALIEAIDKGLPNDESDWIEWKIDLDLNDKTGYYHLARTILGMANRPVDEAARSCGGFGYIVVGIEPGNLHGIEVPDPAHWTEMVDVYVKGQTGPSWSQKTMLVKREHVLVVTIEPPQHGDPIWALHKKFGGPHAGTIFVRKQGKTEPATPSDVGALCDRIRAGRNQLPQVQLEIVHDGPLPWLDRQVAQAQITDWVKTEREHHLKAAQEVEDERTKPTRPLTLSDKNSLHASGINAKQISDLAKVFGTTPDQRTLADYIDELDEWAREIMLQLANDLERRYCDAGHGRAHLKVTNTSPQYLKGIEIQLHLGFEPATGFEEVPDGEDLPKAPMPYGAIESPGLLNPALPNNLLPLLQPQNYDFTIADSTRDTYINDEAFKVTLHAGELRPGASHDGDAFYIFLPDRPVSGQLHASWTATAQDRDGTIDGQLTIQLREAPIDVNTLLPDKSVPE